MSIAIGMVMVSLAYFRAILCFVVVVSRLFLEELFSIFAVLWFFVLIGLMSIPVFSSSFMCLDNLEFV